MKGVAATSGAKNSCENRYHALETRSVSEEITLPPLLTLRVTKPNQGFEGMAGAEGPDCTALVTSRKF